MKEKKKYNKHEFLFPDAGQFSRDKYTKALEFFDAGKDHHIRALFGGNGCGKTKNGAYETSLHLSGLYPSWWTGLRFTHPIKAWGAARENKALAEVMQLELFGNLSEMGTGLIPRDCLIGEDGSIQTWSLPGTGGGILKARIKHYTDRVFDGYSEISFKTYAQGWQEFQGANIKWIWLDEEPDDPKIYSECLARTRGPKGKEGYFIITMTPLLGISTVYLTFVPNGSVPQNGQHPTNKEKYVCIITDEDVPHLSEEWKKSQLEEWKLTDPNSIEARKKGIAAVGSGRIYPIDEDFVCVKPFEIPEYWPRVYGFDFGWNNTAALWIAQDPVSKVKYIYAEYKRGKVVSVIHAEAVKAKGKWIKGVCDPSGGGRRDDGTMFVDHFRTLGLQLQPGVNALAPGIASIFNQFESGALKIFSNLELILKELRTYRYDMRNPNVPARNQDDHLLDSLRYADSRFSFYAISESDYDDFNTPSDNGPVHTGRDPWTGY